VRIRDPELLARLHLEWQECALAMTPPPECLGGATDRSLHHVHKHPRDDVRANLVMLCGDGTRGCHGAITNEEKIARHALGRYIRVHRPDTFAYLTEKLSSTIAADEWLTRRLA
jgi:hypothetical protein